MSSILIVMPILAILMFLIGTELRQVAFKEIIKQPLPILIGLAGQLILLPLIALSIGLILDLKPIYFAGLMLIALSPGGSSSNVFSLIAKGNIELSVLLTLLSSIITIVTLPIAMNLLSQHLLSDTIGATDMIGVKIVLQNILLTIIPIIMGFAMRLVWPKATEKISKVLNKIALPALLVLVFIFMLQHSQEIGDNIVELGGAVSALIIAAIVCSSMLSRVCKLSVPTRRTIVIEVGMQNAAQAMAIATSPFVFNNHQMAIPAILYSLLMNVILIVYVVFVKNRTK